MSDGGLETLQETLDQVRTELRETNARTTATNAKLDEQNAKLTEVDEKLVPRRQFWAVTAVIALVIILALVVGAKFRANDHRESVDRIRRETHEAEVQRANLIAGCGRSNDQRAWGRRLIERAYVSTPIPDGLPPELRDLYLQGQERQATQRAEQLADPGVQPVDCERAFPPVTTEK